MHRKQTHRGQHPQDARLFAPKWLPVLCDATADMTFLLSKGYADTSALKLVGDHYQLDSRQRHAVQRAACSLQSQQYREQHEANPHTLKNRPIGIDGYNLLITAESALAGGILIRCCDGCIRDMAGIHGSYRKVEETYPAIRLIGETLARLEVGAIRWYLDSPVSNSGKLRAILAEEAQERSWNWDVELEKNPDKVLIASNDPVATSDGWILDRAHEWVNLTALIIGSFAHPPRIIDLSRPASCD